MSKPRLAGFPAALFLGGLGLSLYYGNVWRQQASFSEADIQASVDLNLAMDLQRLPEGDRSAATEARLRERVEAELRETIATEQRETRTAFLGGLAALLVSLAQMVWQQRLHRKR